MKRISKYQVEPLTRMPDGTIKQFNPLTGTEVWTVPGRGHRPLTAPVTDPRPLDSASHGRYCAFCEHRALETPPEKSRVEIQSGPAAPAENPMAGENPGTPPSEINNNWLYLPGQFPDHVVNHPAEFRRIPNLFEIVSYDYWHKNHGYTPSADIRVKMAAYLASPGGYEHVQRVLAARMTATGLDIEDIAHLDDGAQLQHATGFFAGGHDVIVARRHYVDGATDNTQLASSGTLTPEEHFHYINFTAQTMEDLYKFNNKVRYVAAFQNWLKPAGASFDHLHKQLVAIDDYSRQTLLEIDRLREDSNLYAYTLDYAVAKNLVIAANDHAVAFAGFGHRYPTIAIWSLSNSGLPWEHTADEIRGVSDILHAVHAATGVEVPCNEEWYHRPPDLGAKLPWRVLLKWRVSTLAGFEGGTRIYLNTIDPWRVKERVVNRMRVLRDAQQIAPMRIGDEAKMPYGLLRAHE